MKSLHRFASKPKYWLCSVGLLCNALLHSSPAAAQESGIAPPPTAKGCIRVATFNVALNRKENGQLVRELKAGDAQAKRIATIVQLVAPDILLANEVDYSDGDAAKLLRDQYFLKSQSSDSPL